MSERLADYMSKWEKAQTGAARPSRTDRLRSQRERRFARQPSPQTAQPAIVDSSTGGSDDDAGDDHE